MVLVELRRRYGAGVAVPTGRAPAEPNFKLSTVAAQLGVVVAEDKLHDALYDVDLTRDAYHIMIDGSDE